MNKKSLCSLCLILFSKSSFDSAQDHQSIIQEYTRQDQLPKCPALASAAEEGYIFYSLLLQRIQCVSWPPDIDIIDIGPVTLVGEADWGYDLEDEEKGVYALEVTVSAKSEVAKRFRFALFSDTGLDTDQYLQTRRRPPQIDRTSPASISQLQTWITECMEHHWECEQNTSAFSPTRLIDVGLPDGTIPPRLIAPHGDSTKYVALSHCWGPPVPGSRMLKTEKHSLQAHMNEIPLAKMPRNFQDAVSMSRALGLRYLWIDSLCIIQDSSEDWAREASLMEKVYKCAWVTLAATSAAASDEGFLGCHGADQRVVIPLEYLHVAGKQGSSRIETPPQDIILQSVDKDPTTGWSTEVDIAIWNGRGWTVQERHLSQRLIHFGKTQIFWECRRSLLEEDLSSSEDGHSLISTGQTSAGSPSSEVPDAVQQDDSSSEDSPTAGTKASAGINQANSWWTRIIGEYSRRNLTYSSDRLPAIGGLASELSQYLARNDIPAHYLAGIWSSNLAYGLLWKYEDPPTEGLEEATCDAG